MWLLGIMILSHVLHDSCTKLGVNTPIAAHLTAPLTTPQQEAFWCLVQICEQYLPGYYSPGLVGMHAQLFGKTTHLLSRPACISDRCHDIEGLVGQIHSRHQCIHGCMLSLCAIVLITAHFCLKSKAPGTDISKGMDPILYCTEWFMSIYSRFATPNLL